MLYPFTQLFVQVDSYNKANKMHIVGYYQGNEHLNDNR